MREVFYYMFKDNKFLKKGLLYAFLLALSNTFMILCLSIFTPHCPRCIVSYPPLFYILSVSGFLINFITVGYCFKSIKALSEQKEDFLLPDFNIPKSFLNGAKYILGLFLPFISVYVIYIAIDIISTKLGVADNQIILSIYSLIILIFFGFYLLAFCRELAITGSPVAFFKFRKVIKSAHKNNKKYLICFGLAALIFILNSGLTYMVSYLFMLIFIKTKFYMAGIVLNLIVSAIINTYFAFTAVLLAAKSVDE